MIASVPPDGEICREFSGTTGRSLPWWVNLDGGPLYSFFHRDYGFRALGRRAPSIDLDDVYRPDLRRTPSSRPLLTLDALNNPVLALAEVLSFRQTGDGARLAAVLPPLLASFESLDDQLRHDSGLLVTDWASMDNSPRNRDLCFGVDTAAQLVLFADTCWRPRASSGAADARRRSTTAHSSGAVTSSLPSSTSACGARSGASSSTSTRNRTSSACAPWLPSGP